MQLEQRMAPLRDSGAIAKAILVCEVLQLQTAEMGRV